MIKKYSIHFIGGDVISIDDQDLISRLFQSNFEASISHHDIVINTKNITYVKEIK